MESHHRRRRVHELQPVHARRDGRIRRQRLAPPFGADAEARSQVDQHFAEGKAGRHQFSRYGDTAMGMVESAMEFLRIASYESYHNIVLRMKSSNIRLWLKHIGYW